MDDDDIKQNLNDLMMQNTEQAEEENADPVIDLMIQHSSGFKQEAKQRGAEPTKTAGNYQCT
ncbi:MAG: hypothetical protein IPM78_12995 [Moraxellaceae bacterium]|nr:hypothetical protein [Moraxellaceae bacterium]